MFVLLSLLRVFSTMQVVQIQTPHPQNDKHKAANFPKKPFFSPLKTQIKSCIFPCHLPLPIHHFLPLNLHFDFRSSRFRQKSEFYLPTWHRPCPVHSCENPRAPNLYNTLLTACLDMCFPLWLIAPSLPTSFLAPQGFLDFLVCYTFLIFLGIRW